MPIFSMQLDNPDLDHWDLFRPEKEFMLMLDHPNIQVVSCTWFPQEKIAEYAAWAESDPHRHTVFISMMDPCSQVFPDHPRVHYVGTKQFVYFAVLVDRYFLKYQPEELMPSMPFVNKFLCYQRKRSEPREALYDALSHKQGIVTLSGRVDPEFNRNLPTQAGLDEIMLDPADTDLMPNDIWSLGNPDIWNSSFLNIVSETVFDGRNHQRAFISEKTFKPIVGMRPFLHYGESDFSELLRDRGFETFDDDFGYDPSGNHHQQAAQLANIVDSIEDADDMYQKLLPKIEHNRNHLSKMAQQELQRIRELAEHYKNLAG